MTTKDLNTVAYMEKQKQKREMRYYLVSFAMMLALTIISFTAVYLYEQEVIKNAAIIMFLIVVLAVIQFMFQLYYFMHMKDEDHGYPAFMIYSGVGVAFITVLSLSAISWI
ncbi:cytochrome C oxidase subunit IV family protein [Tuberibacillus sp. Marseille-P3662]|uniref:cytochrome C oxidase subunit IV family protein n=1 Tax=Tuberibacillus sp. Marseille-P3662 TaxID=1965358 RepID=UPI000A1C832E|nr:cytochrome C oxidase subunit IV family protein [Tuberibacillus sp. Marseille-P3662]